MINAILITGLNKPFWSSEVGVGERKRGGQTSSILGLLWNNVRWMYEWLNKYRTIFKQQTYGGVWRRLSSSPGGRTEKQNGSSIYFLGSRAVIERSLWLKAEGQGISQKCVIERREEEATWSCSSGTVIVRLSNSQQRPRSLFMKNSWVIQVDSSFQGLVKIAKSFQRYYST